MENINLEAIKNVDTDNMYQLLKDYWLHLEKAVNNAKENNAVFPINKPTDFVILGIGGSAISGEILKNLLVNNKSTANISVKVIRGNDIPDIINENTCVFASSYSGNTDETLTALNIVKKKTKNIIAVTSGGKLEAMFKEENMPILYLPKGMMPRCSLVYSFFHLLYVLVRHNILDGNAVSKTVEELINRKNDPRFDYSVISDDNIAINIAKRFYNKIPVVYSSNRLEAPNLRWRAQIQENANAAAFGNLFPEANHNEINGWSVPKDLINRFVVLFLKDNSDLDLIKNAMKLADSVIKNNGIDTLELKANGEDDLVKFFDLICIGDWVSFYLAVMNGVDPTPIPNIMNLKAMMAK
ncbi:MAG: bifunctional phosphoglucose/phosphomannose isomerase [Bacteroidetes bacterium]|nr:bifunctional phosphoglucose/phosphomannose isomerase [Bacteroidota bacterium]